MAFAAATEDSRPVLTGVRMELEGDKFVLAAADGFRLAIHRGSLSEPMTEPTQIIVPARTLLELNRFLGDQEELVEINLDPVRGQILFRLNNIEMISQLIQGTFPNYAQLVPERSTTKALVPVPELLRAARTASILARDGAGIVRIHVLPGSPGVLQVVARADEVGDNVAELDAEVDGEEAKVAFSSKYLLDVLGILGPDKVSLEVNSPSSPGVFRPADASDYVHVIMPMFVQW